MNIKGTVIEMGSLEDMREPGIRIEYGDQIIVISGLTRAQIYAMPSFMFREVTVEIELDTQP
jgi:hypothetical protein